MGTRADFYVGRGPEAEWLGSIAWDGDPSGVDVDVLRSTTDATFRANVDRFFSERDDVTLPARGWPWPWNNSGTTDYAYALDEGAVWASNFGRPWFRVDPQAEGCGEPDDDVEDDGPPREPAIFPDMAERKNTRFDKGSGLIVFGGGL